MEGVEISPPNNQWEISLHSYFHSHTDTRIALSSFSASSAFRRVLSPPPPICAFSLRILLLAELVLLPDTSSRPERLVHRHRLFLSSGPQLRFGLLRLRLQQCSRSVETP